MLKSPVSVYIDDCDTNAFTMPSTYRLTPRPTVGIEQRPFDWLQWVWGGSAIEAMVDRSQGVSETWWRVFKERQT